MKKDLVLISEQECEISINCAMFQSCSLTPPSKRRALIRDGLLAASLNGTSPRLNLGNV